MMPGLGIRLPEVFRVEESLGFFLGVGGWKELNESFGSGRREKKGILLL